MNKEEFLKYLQKKHKDKRTVKYKFYEIHRLRWHEIQTIHKDTNIPYQSLKNNKTLKAYFLNQEIKESE